MCTIGLTSWVVEAFGHARSLPAAHHVGKSLAPEPDPCKRSGPLPGLPWGSQRTGHHDRILVCVGVVPPPPADLPEAALPVESEGSRVARAHLEARLAAPLAGAEFEKEAQQPRGDPPLAPS